MILVWSVSPVQDALLTGTLDASRGGLVDVDVHDAIGGVFLDVEGNGSHADGLALEPANALEGEDVVVWVGEGLVLWEMVLERYEKKK